ncbi:hypothetical protein GGI14_002315 [Coemansia sp. S680]|nr:hypothetical protein GGI14_002315 [Coemansia sp. S680]
MIPAVVVMFSTANSNSVDPSVYIIRTVVFCLMILAFISFINALASRCKADYPLKYTMTVSMLQNALLILWAVFMTYRTFLPLDSPARDSESMFYLLNIAPLYIIGIIPRCTPTETVENAFSFEASTSARSPGYASIPRDTDGSDQEQP